MTLAKSQQLPSLNATQSPRTMRDDRIQYTRHPNLRQHVISRFKNRTNHALPNPDISLATDRGRATKYRPRRTPMPKLTLSYIVHACLWPARVVQARRDLALLASLDDRDLADIGLGRHDLRDATAVGLGKDPTELLAARARERARAAKAA